MTIDQDIDDYKLEVRRSLTKWLTKGMLQGARGGDIDALRDIYRLLGSKGILAPSWTRTQGGQNLPAWAAIAAYEAIVEADIPDTPHILSVQIVGRLLRYHSKSGEWDPVLRDIAAGRTFACVLYSEPSAGSDLSSIRTTAEDSGAYFSLTGTKLLSLYSNEADVGIVLARESGLDGSSNPYASLSLFLTDMKSSGVTVRTLRSLQDEPFCEVRLRGLQVPASNRIGKAGAAWSTLDEGLAAERTGLDHAARARRWLSAARACRLTSEDPGTNARWDVLEARCDAVTSWARVESVKAETSAIRTSDVADVKIAASEIARDIALTAAASPRLGRVQAYDRRVLESAVREAPGLCLSAGTTEMMYETIASVLAEDWEDMLSAAHLAPEPTFYRDLQTSLNLDVGRRLHPELRSDEKHQAAVRELLTSTGLDRLEMSEEDGGLEMSKSYGLTLSFLLGSNFLDDPRHTGADSDLTHTAARLLGASAQALRDTWSYMRTRRQFGRLLSELSPVSYPLIARLVDVRVAARALSRLAAGSSTTDPQTVYALAVDAAVAAVSQSIQAGGTQAMTERSPLGTAYAYVTRTIWQTATFQHAETAALLSTGGQND